MMYNVSWGEQWAAISIYFEPFLASNFQEKYFQVKRRTHLNSYSVNLALFKHITNWLKPYKLYERIETCNHFCYRVIINTLYHFITHYTEWKLYWKHAWGWILWTDDRDSTDCELYLELLIAIHCTYIKWRKNGMRYERIFAYTLQDKMIWWSHQSMVSVYIVHSSVSFIKKHEFYLMRNVQSILLGKSQSVPNKTNENKSVHITTKPTRRI